MARPKKQGKRAKGIQSKKGFLYIVTTQSVLENGNLINKKIWTATGLADTPENIKTASSIRTELLNKNTHAAISGKNITISEYTDIILDEKRRSIADSTYSAYITRSNNITKYFGNIKVKDLNKKLIETFLDSLFIISKLQYRTVKDIKAFLSEILDHAVADGMIPFNPAKDAIISKSLSAEYAKEKSDDDFFSYKEAQKFLELSKDHKLHKLFYVALFFGLRRQEVLGLRWCAIDFQNKTMIINHTVTKGTKGVNRLNTTKTQSSRRQYPLTDAQIEMFKEIKEEEENNRKLLGKAYFDSEYIFKHEDGTLYYPDSISNSFKDFIKHHAELPQRIHFHGLRTSCVSILVHENMNPKAIQQWVGHKDIETTLKIYAKVKEKEEKQAVSDTMKDIITLKPEQ